MSMFSLLLQLSLAACTYAIPLADETYHVAKWDTASQYGTGGGVIGFIILVIDILVWIEVFKSTRPAGHKLLWAVVIFILPIVGPIVYYLFSDRQKWNSGGYEVIP